MTQQPSEDLFFLGVKGLLRNSEGLYLLLRVDPSVWGSDTPVYRDVPGGRVSRGESSEEETLWREIEEETGLKGGKIVRHCGMTVSPLRIPFESTDYGLILSVYLIEVATSSEILFSDEHDALGWFTLEEMLRLLAVKYSVSFLEQLREVL